MAWVMGVIQTPKDTSKDRLLQTPTTAHTYTSTEPEQPHGHSDVLLCHPDTVTGSLQQLQKGGIRQARQAPSRSAPSAWSRPWHSAP